MQRCVSADKNECALRSVLSPTDECRLFIISISGTKIVFLFLFCTPSLIFTKNQKHLSVAVAASCVFIQMLNLLQGFSLAAGVDSDWRADSSQRCLD